MKFTTLTSRKVQANLQRIYDKINPQWHDEGLNWYHKANEYAVFYSTQYKLPVAITSALIAVLSPQKSWYQNLILTQEFLETKGRIVRHYKMQADKARAIYNVNELLQASWGYNGKDLRIYIDSVLHGSKTINFFHNILEPENSNYVTIDSHMIQIMTNTNCKQVTPKQYEFLKAELIKFAAKYGIPAPTMQAKLWVTYRIIKKY